MTVAQVIRSPDIGPQRPVIRPRCLTDDFVARVTASATSGNTNPLTLPWGTNHSSGGNDDYSKRTAWDDAEIDDLGQKLELIRSKFPSGCIPPHTPVVPQLLKMIHADPKAVPIYAKRHIVDSSRLSTGLIFSLFKYKYNLNI